MKALLLVVSQPVKTSGRSRCCNTVLKRRVLILRVSIKVKTWNESVLANVVYKALELKTQQLSSRLSFNFFCISAPFTSDWVRISALNRQHGCDIDANMLTVFCYGGGRIHGSCGVPVSPSSTSNLPSDCTECKNGTLPAALFIFYIHRAYSAWFLCDDDISRHNHRGLCL